MDARIFNSCPRSSSPLAPCHSVCALLCVRGRAGGNALPCDQIFSAVFRPKTISSPAVAPAKRNSHTFRVKYAGTDLHKEKVVYLCVRALCVGSSDLVIKIAWAPKRRNWVLVVYGAVRQNKIMTVAACFMCWEVNNRHLRNLTTTAAWLNYPSNPSTFNKAK
jgi:hypothetical protein